MLMQTQMPNTDANTDANVSADTDSDANASDASQAATAGLGN